MKWSEKHYLWKLDRSKKVTLTTLIQVLGFSGPSEILRLFPSSKTLLMETMLKDEKDGVLSTNTAVEELYSKMRQGERYLSKQLKILFVLAYSTSQV